MQDYTAYFCIRCGLKVRLAADPRSVFQARTQSVPSVVPPHQGALQCPRAECRGPLKVDIGEQ